MLAEAVMRGLAKHGYATKVVHRDLEQVTCAATIHPRVRSVAGFQGKGHILRDKARLTIPIEFADYLAPCAVTAGASVRL